MKNKKGSHLGFILSFVIFITFLLFVYTTLEPTLKIRASKQPVLDFLRFSFVEKMGSNSTMVAITNTSQITSQQNCISLKDIIGAGTNQIPESYITNNNLKIKNFSDYVYNYSRSGQDLKIGVFNSLKEKGFFIKIYYSNEVSQNSGESGTGCNPTASYTISSLKEEQNSIFESNIISLKNSYDPDCGETLKNDFGVPDGNEFTFSFEFANGTIIEPKPECGSIPDTDVYATTFPLEYFNSDANPEIGFLTIKVW
ncbi:MAG: hypothetical protein AABX93_02070 [Nanoarchaeota archaeon]